MRENFMIQKLWSVFLKRKMEHEMRKTSSVEDAFQKIRAATGLTDVQDIVHKFLTREQTYSQLLVAVAENERKIDMLKKENEECNEQLHNILIDKEGIEKRKTAPEIEQLDLEISGLKKELDASKDRSQRVEIVTDQIYGWARKVLLKMDRHFTEGIDMPNLNGVGRGGLSLVELFEKITNAVCS